MGEIWGRNGRETAVAEWRWGQERQGLLAKIPVGKFCLPEEVAHTTEFLVSPLAGFITGEIIDQNGGFQMD